MDDLKRVSVRKLRNEISDNLNRVAYGHERLVVERRGKDIAAVVPLEDLKLIEAMEDKIDLEEARRILADPKEKPIPWEKVKKELGL